MAENSQCRGRSFAAQCGTLISFYKYCLSRSSERARTGPAHTRSFSSTITFSLMPSLPDNYVRYANLCSLSFDLTVSDQERWKNDRIPLQALSAYLLLLHQRDFSISYYQDADTGQRTPLFDATWLRYSLPTLDLDANFGVQVSLWRSGAGWSAGSNYAPTVRDTLALHPAKQYLPPEMQSATSLASRVAQHIGDDTAVCWQVVYSAEGVPVSSEREYPGWMLLLDHPHCQHGLPNQSPS